MFFEKGRYDDSDSLELASPGVGLTDRHDVGGREPGPAQSDTTGKAAITARVRLSADDNAKGGKPSQVQQGINSRLPLRATFADLDNDGKLDVFSPNQNGVLAFIASFRDSADETLGATLQPVSESLRAQLNIPAGQGLLVASLKSDGPTPRRA